MSLTITLAQEFFSLTQPPESGALQNVAIAPNGQWLAVQDKIFIGGGIAGQVNLYKLVGGVFTFQQSLTRPGVGGSDSYSVPVLFSADSTAFFVGQNNGPGQGKVYVYTLVAGSWTLQQTLQGTDGAIADEYGWALASPAGQSLLVGAPLSTGGGNLYYYTAAANVWTLQQKFQGGDTTAEFGSCLAAGAGWLVVQGSAAAAATRNYFFSLAGVVWTQQQEIAPAASFTYGSGGVGGASTGSYGVSMSASGKTAVLGGLTTAVGGPPFFEFAEVWVLTAGVWVLQQRLLHALDVAGDRDIFAGGGTTPAISNDDSSVVVGAAEYPNNGIVEGDGAVFVYTVAGGVWSLQATLLPDTSNPGFEPQAMGESVSGSVSLGLILAGTSNGGGFGAGPAYLFSLLLPTQVITLAFKGAKVFGSS